MDQRRKDRGPASSPYREATTDVQSLEALADTDEQETTDPAKPAPAPAPAPGPGPGPGKWLDGVQTTVWQGEAPVEQSQRRRTTAPYTSTALRAERPEEPEGFAARREPGDALERSAARRSRARTAEPEEELVERSAARRAQRVEPLPPRAVDVTSARGVIESRDVGASRRAGVSASRAWAARAEPPLGETRELAEDVEGRPTRPQPLQIEAPLLIKERALERVSPDPALWLMTQPGSPMAEQYRVLALKLREARGLRVVALAAPTTSRDGTLAAANITLALGEGTRCRVLLLEANLRHPELAELFGLESSVNLADQVRQHRRSPRDPWEALALSGSVSLLPAGGVERNPAAVLSSETIADLMQEARRAYDYLVVAPPPVMESADINILQDHLDGAILVVRAGRTRRESVAASIKQLGARRFLGVVLVGV